MFRKQKSRSDNISYKILINNQVDDDIQRIIRPFKCALGLFGTLRYNIKNNRICTNGKKYYLFAFCWMMFLNVLCVYRMFTVDVFKTDKMTELEYYILNVLCVTFFIAYSFEFTLMFIQDVIHADNVILFVMKIHSIHRSIGSRKTIRSYVIWNWVSLTTIISTNIVVRILYYTSHFYTRLTDQSFDIICDTGFIVLEVNMMIVYRILLLLTKYVNIWIDKVALMDSDEDEEQCRKLFDVYKNIMESFVIYKKMVQAWPFFHGVGAFYRNIMYFHFMVYSLRTSEGFGTDAFFHFVSILLWLINDIGFIMIFCFKCENFYFTIEEAQSKCIQLLLNVNCPVSQRHLCKKVVRANRCFSKMTAWGLYNVDVILPISFIAVISYYAIVLLQFYLL